MELQTMYRSLGISPAVYALGQEVLSGLTARFEAVDAVAEFNQGKVIAAIREALA